MNKLAVNGGTPVFGGKKMMDLIPSKFNVRRNIRKKKISARVFWRKNLRMKNTENTEKRMVMIGIRTFGLMIIWVKVCDRSLER